ncbi:SemiSWEET transporter [Piscinibacter sp.]|uniref:SemiSWEET transporter n=1 Tax=Piscinibacter sp. TaxID=1903157 RepID=UPI002CFC7A91|nr:SemiSWEET transporter [Albitalea sp.]HUG24888.1 SemiSWEET transporter [Albitalea sp.]
MTPFTPVDWLGYAAATLTTSAFIPQVWHTFRTRDVSGISLGMYSVLTLGIVLWLAYGAVLGAWPVIIANIVTLVFALSILAMKIVIERRRRGGIQNR